MLVSKGAEPCSTHLSTGPSAWGSRPQSGQTRTTFVVSTPYFSMVNLLPAISFVFGAGHSEGVSDFLRFCGGGTSKASLPMAALRARLTASSLLSCTVDKMTTCPLYTTMR